MRVLALAALAVLLGAGTAAADDTDPPNRTGCCFSFDHSPVTAVFCLTDGACRFGPKEAHHAWQ